MSHSISRTRTRPAIVSSTHPLVAARMLLARANRAVSADIMMGGVLRSRQAKLDVLRAVQILATQTALPQPNTQFVSRAVRDALRAAAHIDVAASILANVDNGGAFGLTVTELRHARSAISAAVSGTLRDSPC